jgi:chromosome segregation ATPase
MNERTKNLQGFLDDRSESEITHLTSVMTELERSIRETLDKKHGPQLEFDWTENEKAQRQRDLDSLRHRIKQIPAELEREIAHLRSRYANPQPRLFPLAVTFLVPYRAVAQLQKGGKR